MVNYGCDPLSLSCHLGHLKGAGQSLVTATPLMGERKAQRYNPLTSQRFRGTISITKG
jgi:hypothetical protein